ncbi:MAG: twitching motility protein PilI [Oleiphilaceae bacterium]|jgi:twitching motility protein PilI
MTSLSASPFGILTEISQRSLESAAGLPAQDEAAEMWNGIGFEIAGTNYVAAMGSISEILHLPKFTSVPGVKSWMLGIANVRGRLLPIMDLSRFFGLEHSSLNSRDKRVLVVDHGEVLSGFIVDNVMGMQYFPVDEFKKGAPTQLVHSIQPFIKGKYIKSGVDWNVFDSFVLTANDKFLDVAVQ